MQTKHDNRGFPLPVKWGALLLLLLSGCQGSGENVIEILRRANDHLKQIESISYSASIKSDTRDYTGECWVKKVSSDTLFG